MSAQAFLGGGFEVCFAWTVPPQIGVDLNIPPAGNLQLTFPGAHDTQGAL